MNNYQFIEYISTPRDGLQLGIAVILDVAQQEIKRYKHMQKKDGSSTYFATASVCVTDAHGVKKYYDCMEQDSRSKQELLMSFIRKNVATELERPHPTEQPSVFGQGPLPGIGPILKSDDDQGVPF